MIKIASAKDIETKTFNPEFARSNEEASALKHQRFKKLPSDAPSSIDSLSTVRNLTQAGRAGAPPSKYLANLNDLKGSWFISYTIISSYNDKIVLDNNYQADDGSELVTGYLYADGNEDNPKNIACSAIIDQFDVLCITAYFGIYEAFAFSLDNRQITEGYYSISTSVYGVASGILSKNYPLTGYKAENAEQSFDSVFQSAYKLIQWEPRFNNNFYCIDITDENWNIYPGFQAIRCEENMSSFSPIDYVRNVYHTELPSGFTFYWRVWSAFKDAKGTIFDDHYGGSGYEGKVVVP